MRFGSAMMLLLLLAACSSLPSPQEAAAPPQVQLTEEDRKGDPRKTAPELIEHRESPGALDHAVALLDWHLQQHPDDGALRLLLAEAHSRACEVLDAKKADDKAAHQQHRTQGLAAADLAVRALPDSGPAHYWRGCLLLHHADAESSYARLKEALPELLQAEKLDPKYDQGGPARMLGRIYQETPGWPFLGSYPKAIEWYKKSLTAAPSFITTRLWLGETYIANKEPDLAREQLDRAKAERPRAGHEKEDGDSREKAETLLKKLSAK